jgi:hypothetical protein
VKQLISRGYSVAFDGSVQLLTPAFHCTITCEGCYPIRRPVADVIGECVNAVEPGLLKKTAQAAAHIQLSDARGPPQLLADFIKTLRPSRLLAPKNKAAVILRRGSN